LTIYFVFPEAKGRTFAELDELFERRIPAWRFSTTKTAVNDAADHEAAAQRLAA